MIGKIIYSDGNEFKILSNNKIVIAKPLGVFRHENTKFLVGDNVEIELGTSTIGNSITKLLPRKNEFIRPNIANVDNVLIVTSVDQPKFNSFYLDKLITIFNSFAIKPILVFTKTDLKIDDFVKADIEEFEKNFEVFKFSTHKDNSNELTSLIKRIKNQLSVITGQTGVGKSTLLNLANEKLNLKTNEISKALGRGKHTTTRIEAHLIDDEQTFLIDTPGFSSLSIKVIDEENLHHNFFNFDKYADKCHFNNCSHTHENKCYIKELVQKGNISQARYSNYLKLLKEFENDI